MPSQKEHERACLRELGREFSQVHQFLDQFHAEFRGFAHRRLLHHRLGIELCVARLGEEARPAAVLHVTQDFGGWLPESWADLEEYTFFLNDEEERQREILTRLYGDKLLAKLGG